MPTSNGVPTERQHDFVASMVQTGRYQNTDEVLREGLRLIEQRERMEAAKILALREAANRGWMDIEAGRYADISDAQLEDTIGQLGRRAAECVAGRK
ncbi:antitoxin ParD1/3/4 [Kerstersia gyiorum]|uniref:Antitoxin ParD1/3/4 n=1 Tax=Kerstersia gyiorum TaxID=206506 RepID=A0A4Q7MM75_9BURK|nr:type II toxin-antitoxin system ParD family antitoxin [Kerstersia gyiorum]KAB0544403.1 type II toxin-antitoxin system ParD family antitoxin [Kerstersia gyiorum]RZS69525.1 antitoxin ParD1/3/4 [Kerstersia gyiorum]